MTRTNSTSGSSEVMDNIPGFSFKVIGPFLVADLSDKPESVFNELPVAAHGMEDVFENQKTQAHVHEFPSFYKSVGLNVESNGALFNLPDKALTLVLPGVDHSWLPHNVKGLVGSMDSRHEKQIIKELAA